MWSLVRDHSSICASASCTVHTEPNNNTPAVFGLLSVFAVSSRTDVDRSVAVHGTGDGTIHVLARFVGVTQYPMPPTCAVASIGRLLHYVHVLARSGFLCLLRDYTMPHTSYLHVLAPARSVFLWSVA